MFLQFFSIFNRCNAKCLLVRIQCLDSTLTKYRHILPKWDNYSICWRPKRGAIISAIMAKTIIATIWCNRKTLSLSWTKYTKRTKRICSRCWVEPKETRNCCGNPCTSNWNYWPIVRDQLNNIEPWRWFCPLVILTLMLNHTHVFSNRKHFQRSIYSE